MCLLSELSTIQIDMFLSTLFAFAFASFSCSGLGSNTSGNPKKLRKKSTSLAQYQLLCKQISSCEGSQYTSRLCPDDGKPAFTVLTFGKALILCCQLPADYSIHLQKTPVVLSKFNGTELHSNFSFIWTKNNQMRNTKLRRHGIISKQKNTTNAVTLMTCFVMFSPLNV